MPIVALCHLMPRSLCCSGQGETEMASPEWVRLLRILCPQVEAHLRAQAKMRHISKATFLCPLPTDWVVRESVPPDTRTPVCIFAVEAPEQSSTEPEVTYKTHSEWFSGLRCFATKRCFLRSFLSHWEYRMA